MSKNYYYIFSLFCIISCTNNKHEYKSLKDSDLSNQDSTNSVTSIIKQISEASSALKDTLPKLETTVIADFPDSLKPKITLLENIPKPVIVMIPKNKGGSYSYPNRKGELKIINLEPPVIIQASSLREINGESIADTNGHPFTGKNKLIFDFKTFSPLKGLAIDSFITCIKEDKHGNLWFGTGNGVIRYDGKSFVSFTTSQGLANNTIYCIEEDRHGNLWFGTDAGMSCFDGKSFINFNPYHGVLSNTIFSIKEDKHGNLWLSTEAGMICYDGKSFFEIDSKYGLGGMFRPDISKDKNGNLWICSSHGLSRYDGKFIVNFTFNLGLLDHMINCITEDKHSNLWIGTANGVSCYNGNTLNNFTDSMGLVNNFVFCITEDRYGSLWFGTQGMWLSHYDGKSFVNATFSSSSYKLDYIRSILEDKHGNLWLGTNKGLYVRWNRNNRG